MRRLETRLDCNANRMSTWMCEDAKFHVWLLSGYCNGYSVAIVGLNHKEGHVHLHTLFCTRVTVATQWPHSGHTVATQWPHSGHW